MWICECRHYPSPALSQHLNVRHLHARPLQAHQVEQLCQRLCGEVEASRRQLAEAQQHSSAVTLQLASRNKLVEALQAQLRTVAVGSRGSGSSSVAEGTQTEPSGFLLAPPAPAAAPPEGAGGTGGVTADALHSLDRIVGFWREACDTKQHQIEGLRAELAQVRGMWLAHVLAIWLRLCR